MQDEDHIGAGPAMPKAYEPKEAEDPIYEEWERSGYFDPDNLPGERKDPFVVMMPPPNATGTLHIGHAMFLTLEDLMTRFQRMRGKAALWLPGTDHAAIATNTKVEKILASEGRTKYDLGRAAFIDRVKEYIAGSQGTIRRQIRKMGSSCDWSRERYTFDDDRSRAVREMFVRMYRDGLIYRGHRIVNWCPRCESTLADDEVEYKESQGTLWYLKYGPFSVATTRPETKLGDTAVAVHPEDERYARRIGETFEVDFGIGPMPIRVIGDAGVDREFGTGVVGVTPAHSAVDFEMAEKNMLPVKKVIGEDGKMTALAGKYAGMPVAEARAAFVEDLAKAGLIERTEDITNNLSVCYRCGTPVEPLTSRQWFVDVNREVPGRGMSLKAMALDAVRSGRVGIIPDRFEKVYFHWMENLRDWCISRQIWFGHRVPVWYCASCHVDGDAPERAGDPRASEKGGRPGVVVSAETPTRCPDCGRGEDPEGLVQDPDTLDTWFSSGTWTFSTLGWPQETADLRRFHPTQVLETGYDILFFWVARMILMTTYAVGEVPFEKVYLHGLVRDEQGRKMSKSLENIIDPLDVAEKYGTDAVRLSLVIGNTAGNDLKLSEEKIAHFRNFTNKLWNISRFALMTAGTLKVPAGRPEPETLADRWILSRFDAVAASVTDDLEDLNFSRPGETLRDFTWGELADWYLEVAKIEGGKGEMLSYLVYGTLRLWHPFMPFVTERIYKEAFSPEDGDLLMVAHWPEDGAAPDADAVADFSRLQEVITSIRNIRATYNVEPAKKIAEVDLFGRGQDEFIAEHGAIIRGLARVERLTSGGSDKTAPNAASAVVSGFVVTIPLGGMVDLNAERKKLSGELAEAERYLGTIEKKLSNPDFTDKAPAHVVDAERAKKAAQEERVSKLRERIASLG